MDPLKTAQERIERDIGKMVIRIDHLMAGHDALLEEIDDLTKENDELKAQLAALKVAEERTDGP